MSEDNRSKKTDLVLSNGQYAFTQDSTTGAVKVLTGPTVLNVTGQEYPVVYDASSMSFVAVTLDEAALQSPMAPQGFYVELYNPPATEAGDQPTEGSKENSPQLLMGRRLNIPGPTTFSLWPRQIAKAIEGHTLRSNQYLLGRVYDEEAARTNWRNAVLKTRGDEGAGTTEDGPQSAIGELREDELAVGQLFVIKGTEVSFYIPPTGVEVVPDAAGCFVRDALTLERLQYCILVDENGDKDYQRGPKVVFPRPTQRFYEDGRSGTIVFRPTELNPIQGIHVKVIAPYVDEEGQAHDEGEELFITGERRSIYFPRPEHSLIRYDGSGKHFAAAVPSGEARYVMDRLTSQIRTVHGPTMLLCDPRSDVVVRRVLSARECALWYPGNDEVAEHNSELRELLGKRPSTRAALSEGEARRGQSRRQRTNNKASGPEQSSVHSAASGPVADEFVRAASYNEPRTLTLRTHLTGTPSVQPWAGFAIQVLDPAGSRRVVRGPARVMLDYDETLETFALSSGTPKSPDERHETVYLRLEGNRIGDSVVARSRDHVDVSFGYVLTVDFVGDEPERWFRVRDYVALLCAEVRLRLESHARDVSVQELHRRPEAALRDAALGLVAEGVRPGLFFEQNAMLLRDVQVSRCEIVDPELARMVRDGQAAAVAGELELESQQRRLETDRGRHALHREDLREKAVTRSFEAELEKQQLARTATLAEARAQTAVLGLHQKTEEQRAQDGLADERQTRELARKSRGAEAHQAIAGAQLELELARIDADTKAAVARFEAAEGGLSEAIQLLGNQDVLAKVAEAISAQRLFGGKDVANVVGNLFSGTPLAEVFEEVQSRAARGSDDG